MAEVNRLFKIQNILKQARLVCVTSLFSSVRGAFPKNNYGRKFRRYQ